jgi:hypothetical protein
MKNLKYGTIFLCVFTLSGCFVSESKYQKSVEDLSSQIELLQSNLGTMQYIGLDPEITLSIKDVEFNPAEEYGSPTVKFKVNLKQTNIDFPLENYGINLYFSVLDANGNEVSTIAVSSDVEFGVLSLAEDKSMYSLKSSNLSGYKLKVKYFNWYPSLKLQIKES